MRQWLQNANVKILSVSYWNSETALLLEDLAVTGSICKVLTNYAKS